MLKNIINTFTEDLQKAYQEKDNPQYYKKSGKLMLAYTLFPLILGFLFKLNTDTYYFSLALFAISAFMVCYGLYMILANEKIAKRNKVRHTRKELNNILKYSPTILIALFIWGIFVDETLNYPIIFLAITLAFFAILKFKK